jgi:glycosyltransferase involved in cell wall biosynthesis
LTEIIYFTPLFFLAIVWLLQLYYLLAVYLKLRNYTIPAVEEGGVFPPLSVVICARNEEENLSQFLPLVLEQDYPDFEVVVVNDCSSDDSEWLLKTLAERYPHLNVVNIKEHPRYKHGKKFAVTIGIKATKNNCMVFTDADCKPASTQWLKHMGNSFKPGIEIVLGYSPYFKLRSFLNKNIRFETFHTALSYLSYSLKGRSYMGVGRNLAYTKTLFFDGKGFASHMHIPSGDDDLFVNQNATSTNTAICIHSEAHVWSAPKLSFSEYSSQKLRHHGASKAYKAGHKRMLSSQLISAVLFYALLMAAFFIYPGFWEFLLIAYLFRLLVQVIVYQPAMKKLQALDVLAYLPILDFVYYFNTCVNGFRSLFKRNVKWK